MTNTVKWKRNVAKICKIFVPPIDGSTIKNLIYDNSLF